MTLRGLARGSILYSIGFVLPRVGSFLLLPVYVRYLTTTDFGAISLVVSVASLLAVVLRLGLDGSLMRLYLEPSYASQQGRLVATITTLTAIAGVGGALLAALLAYFFFAALFTGLSFVPFGMIAAVLSLTTTFQFLPATVYRARSEPARFLGFAGSAFIVTATVTVILLAVFRLGVLGALLGQLAGGVYVLGYSGVMLWRSGGFVLDATIVREALRFGLPLVPHGLSGWLLNVSDRWLLSLVLPLGALAARSAIGVYSLGYQLAYAIDLLAQSFNAAWVPFFYRYGGTSQGPGIHREMTTLMVAGFGSLGAVLALNASLVVTIIARPTFAAAADLIPILSVGFVFHAFYIAVVTVIFFARRTGVLPLITGASAAVNVVTNVALIPPLGIQGAAWATLVAFAFMAVATTIAARRAYPLQLDWTRLLILIGGVIGVAWYAANRRAVMNLGSFLADAALSAGIVLVALAVAWGPMRSLRGVTRAAAHEA